MNPKSQSFLACGAATKFVLSRVDSLSSCRNLQYTFRDVNRLNHFQAAKITRFSWSSLANIYGALCERTSVSMGTAKSYFVKKIK